MPWRSPPGSNGHSLAYAPHPPGCVLMDKPRSQLLALMKSPGERLSSGRCVSGCAGGYPTVLSGMERAGGGGWLLAVPGHGHRLGLLLHAWAWAGPAARLGAALPKQGISHPGSRRHSEFHSLLGQQA